MVVLASAITTKNGKALLSRQYVELSKARIEGLLAAFPKLMSVEKQHTFVETESVRYVYQPMEGLYMLLITNKTSNILADLETLHLLAKIVPEYCQILEEKEILRKAFEIIFAFDEAIAMGYKEKVNLQQIKHFTTMESLDEERHKLEEQNKMALAKKEMERQRKAIERKRLESKMTGFGGGGGSGDSYSGGMGGGRGDSSGRLSSPVVTREPVVESRREAPRAESAAAPGRGMKLGSKTGGKPSLLTQVLKEENVLDEPVTRGAAASSLSAAQDTGAKVQLVISEKIALVAKNDGGLDSLEVKGELSVQVNDPNLTRLKLHISQGDNKDFQFKTHPNMNKNAWNDSVLALKNPEKGYPVGTSTSVLKWRYFTTDEDRIPLAISVWPQTSGGETSVPIEFEKKCDFDLADVTIAIPIPGTAAPQIGDSVGSCEFSKQNRVLHWSLPLIDESNANGSMEFTVPPAPNGAFFPVTVDFRSNSTFAALQVVEAVLEDSGKSVDFAADTSLTVEQYEIQ